MKGACLGPAFNDKDIISMARKHNAIYQAYENYDLLVKNIAGRLADGHVVGWFQGRMEFGPRALGSRSILADARNPDMQQKLNLKIKRREGFRPFAPSVLEEDMAAYFDLAFPSPYMMLVMPVKKEHLRSNPDPDGKEVFERLYQLRSDIPAVTHIDNSARIQSVNKNTHPRFWTLIKEFRDQTGCSVLVNSSFNVRGEPIVCTPEDAFRCFMATDMDFLVMENVVFEKTKQADLDQQKWKKEFLPD
jgi:carbamoyltransferase